VLNYDGNVIDACNLAAVCTHPFHSELTSSSR
jgi:hypothetical protein